MTTHKLSYLGYLISVMIIVGAYWRWVILWNDYSQAIFGVSFGLGIGIFSYIWSWMHEKDEEIINMRKQYQAIVSMWTKNEKEDMVRIAKGEEIR